MFEVRPAAGGTRLGGPRLGVLSRRELKAFLPSRDRTVKARWWADRRLLGRKLRSYPWRTPGTAPRVSEKSPETLPGCTQRVPSNRGNGASLRAAVFALRPSALGPAHVWRDREGSGGFLGSDAVPAGTPGTAAMETRDGSLWVAANPGLESPGELCGLASVMLARASSGANGKSVDVARDPPPATRAIGRL